MFSFLRGGKGQVGQMYIWQDIIIIIIIIIIIMVMMMIGIHERLKYHVIHITNYWLGWTIIWSNILVHVIHTKVLEYFDGYKY